MQSANSPADTAAETTDTTKNALQKTSEIGSGTSTPAHPPCTLEFHAVGAGCGFGHCAYCDTDYSLGQRVGDKIWHHFPHGEYAYWEHCASDKHQAVMLQHDRNISYLLKYFDNNWERLRADNKLYRQPEMIALRSLLR